MGKEHQPASAPAPSAGLAPTSSPPGVDQPAGNAAEASVLPEVPAAGLGPVLDSAAVAGEPHPGDPPTWDAAIGLNRTVYAWAADIVDQNKDRPVDAADPTSRANVLRNTTQWIDEGRATLHLLTPTHDSHLRAGIARSKVAYFQGGRDWRAGPGTYRSADDGIDDRSGITVDSRSAAGGMEAEGDRLTVIGPRSRKELEETLVHEVQHDADQHNHDAEGHAHFREDVDKTLPNDDLDAFVAGSWVYNKWKSEFRAYWLDDTGKFGSASDPGAPMLVRAVYGGRSEVATTAFANRRQSDIFGYMRQGHPKEDRWLTQNNDWATVYAPIFHYYAFDPAFRRAVDQTEIPSGGNLINSVRIQALSEALSHGEVDAVLTAARALDDADRAFLRDRKQSGPFWSQVGRDLRRFDDIEALAELIDLPASARDPGRTDPDVAAPPPTAPDTVEVRRGDTLGRLARRHLGDSGRWPEILELNRDQIADPNHLRRGMVLTLPAP